jgi:hypothetical protein
MTPHPSSHSFQYVACDIPPGMTIDSWKRERTRTTTRTGRRRPLRSFLAVR